jgi:cell fate regulator YaaT (PSP1 superfamily)
MINITRNEIKMSDSKTDNKSSSNQNSKDGHHRKKGFVIPTDNDAVKERRKRQERKLQEEIDKQESKYEVGQKLNFVRVRFPGHANSYPFLVGNRTIAYGQKVVAMSERGVAVGYINSFEFKLPFHKNLLPIKSITKIATDEDFEKEKESYKEQRQTEAVCIRAIEKHNLDMNLTHVEFTQFGKKVVFYFTSPARVDFRDLVKDLVRDLKLRIELRQISVRDRSAAIGGIGPCGRLLCCSSFLNKYGNVNIKMAKNQNLTLSFDKLNGVCGQLKCCLQYENEVYSQKRSSLPREYSFIETQTNEKGKVLRLHLLSEQFDMLTDKGTIRRYSKDQFKHQLKNDYKFPERFKHISDETSKVIGLTDFEAQNTRKFEDDIAQLKLKDSKYTEDIFQSLFGQKSFTQETEVSASTDTVAKLETSQENSQEILGTKDSDLTSPVEVDAVKVATEVTLEVATEEVPAVLSEDDSSKNPAEIRSSNKKPHQSGKINKKNFSKNKKHNKNKK